MTCWLTSLRGKMCRNVPTMHASFFKNTELRIAQDTLLIRKQNMCETSLICTKHEHGVTQPKVTHISLVAQICA